MIRRSTTFALATLAFSAPPTALMAQEERQNGGRESMQGMTGEDEGDEIIVTGAQQQRGAVIGDIKPEQQLGAADVRALGVTSVSELLTELAPQVNAAGGSPVVLLNGKRISSFSEIQDLPAEAIARVDILPEQVSLSYGYSPNQKVVNIVLRRRFRAETGEVRGGLSTDGGGENGRLNAGLLRIRGDNRFTLDLKYNRAASLLESERGIVAASPSRPYALGGNITGVPLGSEIDAALSGLAGTGVTIAAVPASAANGAPALADFVARANDASISNLGRYRTLSPATESFSANATLARALGNVSASLNGRLELSDSDSLQGLPSLALTLPAGSPFSPFGQDVALYRYLDQLGALGQRIRGTTGHVGLTLNGGLAKGWQWSFTGAGDISDTRTRTDRGVSSNAVQSAIDARDATLNPYGALPPALLSSRLTDRAESHIRSIVGDLLINGTLFDMPAGAVTTSLRLGASANGFNSESVRSGTAFSARYAREIGSGQASIDLPLTSRSKGILGAVGDIGVNLNAGLQEISDFGTLTTLGYGMRWTPVSAIRIIASASQDRAAPTGQQINDPSIVTPNVSVFDYARGETVFVSQISGGNPALSESVRDQFRLGVTVKPFTKTNLTFTANYLNSRTSNPIAAFPTPTPAIEAAFPQRFVRDADGALLQIDSRPVNFLRSQSEQLRWGVDLSIPIKSAMQKKFEAWRAAGSKPEDRPADLRALFGNRGPEGGERPGGADQQDRPREERGGDQGSGGAGAGGPPRGPGGGGFGGPRGGGQGGGRLQFSLYHTWHLTESILIAPGVPMLDLLDGDATGSSGGQPRHEIEARAGYTNNGLGARLSVNWESGTHVDGALGGASRLDFGSLATADLRLFANLGQMPKLVSAHPFLRGTRISLSIDNIFNTRRNVTDATGATPLRYQPGYLDPMGRTVMLSVRKLFF